VVVIGGGDTGSDCIGTSFRQVRCRYHFEIMPQPPEKENKSSTQRLAAAAYLTP
jgi:glutamate synthase (NADPH/NADH) small chain